MSPAPRYVVFDRAFPVSESALAGADPYAMPLADLLAAVLVTHLEGLGAIASADPACVAKAKLARDFLRNVSELGAGHGTMARAQHRRKPAATDLQQGRSQ